MDGLSDYGQGGNGYQHQYQKKQNNNLYRADSAVVIKARSTTKPIKQWQVKREFNRRLKKRFDELDIEIPFPQQDLHLRSVDESAAEIISGKASKDRHHAPD